MREASTLPMNGLTAQLTLDLLALQPGDTLAVTGAAGCYGGYTVQLGEGGRSARASPTRLLSDEELVRALGADVIVPRGPDVAAHIRHVVPDGVDALADGSVQNDGRDRSGSRRWRLRIGAWLRRARARARSVFHQVWVRDYVHERAKLDRLRQTGRGRCDSRCGSRERSPRTPRPRRTACSRPAGSAAASSSSSDLGPTWRRRVAVRHST